MATLTGDRHTFQISATSLHRRKYSENHMSSFVEIIGLPQRDAQTDRQIDRHDHIYYRY